MHVSVHNMLLIQTSLLRYNFCCLCMCVLYVHTCMCMCPCVPCACVCVCVCVCELRTVYHVFSLVLLYVLYLLKDIYYSNYLFFVLNVQSCKVVGTASGVG